MKKDPLLSKRDRPDAVRNGDRLTDTRNRNRLHYFQRQTWSLCCTGEEKKSGSLLSDTDRFTDVGHKKPSVI